MPSGVRIGNESGSCMAELRGVRGEQSREKLPRKIRETRTMEEDEAEFHSTCNQIP